MLKKLVEKKKSIQIICSILLLALWTLTLIFDNREDKILALILSLIFPFVVYGFVRLMFKVVAINASLRILKFFLCFFLFFGMLGYIIMIVQFVTEFPNGLTPTFSCLGGLFIATLDEAGKICEAEPKE